MYGNSRISFSALPVLLLLIVHVCFGRQQNVASSSSISTVFYGGSAFHGAMFDIQANRDITITGMDVHTTSQLNENYEIWVKSGTWVNYDKDSMYWTMISCGQLKGEGYSQPTNIPPDLFSWVAVAADERLAIYTTLVQPGGGNLQYTEVPLSMGDTGDVYVENDDIALMIGVGKGYSFSTAVYQRRLWNGSLYYMIGLQTRPDRIGESACRPSMSPSFIPTHVPIEASSSPSRMITASPSFLDSASPTYKSEKPSSLPSKSPTKIPTRYPSISPTFSRTLSPARTPSTSPPTNAVTNAVTNAPVLLILTKIPSTLPPIIYSPQPSFHPSSYPFYSPSPYQSIVQSNSLSSPHTSNPSQSLSFSSSLSPSSVMDSPLSSFQLTYFPTAFLQPPTIPSIQGYLSLLPSSLPSAMELVITESARISDSPSEISSEAITVLVSPCVIAAVAAAAAASASASAASSAASTSVGSGPNTFILNMAKSSYTSCNGVRKYSSSLIEDRGFERNDSLVELRTKLHDVDSDKDDEDDEDDRNPSQAQIHSEASTLSTSMRESERSGSFLERSLRDLEASSDMIEQDNTDNMLSTSTKGVAVYAGASAVASSVAITSDRDIEAFPDAVSRVSESEDSEPCYDDVNPIRSATIAAVTNHIHNRTKSTPTVDPEDHRPKQLTSGYRRAESSISLNNRRLADIDDASHTLNIPNKADNLSVVSDMSEEVNQAKSSSAEQPIVSFSQFTTVVVDNLNKLQSSSSFKSSFRSATSRDRTSQLRASLDRLGSERSSQDNVELPRKQRQLGLSLLSNSDISKDEKQEVIKNYFSSRSQLHISNDTPTNANGTDTNDLTSSSHNNGYYVVD